MLLLDIEHAVLSFHGLSALSWHNKGTHKLLNPDIFIRIYSLYSGKLADILPPSPLSRRTASTNLQAPTDGCDKRGSRLTAVERQILTRGDVARLGR